MVENCVITGEVLLHEVLPCGLPIYVMEKPGYLTRHAEFAARYGSIDLRFCVDGGKVEQSPPGIAHFLEHKLFEQVDGDVMAKFADLGASVNASTGTYKTSYLFSSTAEYPDFFKALAELLQFVQTPAFSDESVARERAIIGQELKMYEDRPYQVGIRSIMKSLYCDHPVRLDIGGTLASIEDITAKWLHKVHQVFYHPANMALFVVGDVDGRRVIDEVAEILSRRSYDPAPEVVRLYPKEPLAVRQDHNEIEAPVSRPIYFFGLKHQPPRLASQQMKHQLAMDISWRLLTARSAPLVQDLYDDGIISAALSSVYQQNRSYAYSLLGCETDDVPELDRRLRLALDQLVQGGVEKADFERHRRSIYAGFLSSFNSLEYIASSFLGHQFRQMPLLDLPEVLLELNVKDIQAVVEQNMTDPAAVSLVVPTKGADK